MTHRPRRDLARLFLLAQLSTTPGLAACGVERVTISGNSMAPALANGDWAIVDRQAGDVERGHIVAFKWPRDESKSFVQRVVGLPGERIAMANGRVEIDGRPIDEAYVADANRSTETWEPRMIPPGEYFVMGDNRRNSSDSRSWGTVKRELIWGRVMQR